jgi:FkbM family methyltransferase
MKSLRELATAATDRLMSPFVPSGKLLPFKYWLHRLRGSCEAELVHLDRISGSTGAALDIGAIHGFYTYRLSQRFSRVYAFEINNDVTQWIERYNRENINLIHYGLSSVVGTATLYVPVMHNLALSGWGSLDPENLKEAQEHRVKEVRLARLDDFRIANVGFVKIDVEGHEMKVLEGAIVTISRSRPIVLIEVRDHNLHSVDSWFRDLQYRRCRLEDLMSGACGEKENYIFLPTERLSEFDAAHDDDTFESVKHLLSRLAARGRSILSRKDPAE